MSTSEVLFYHGIEYGNPSDFRMEEQNSLLSIPFLKSGVIYLEEEGWKSQMRNQTFSTLAFLQIISLRTFRVSVLYEMFIPTLLCINSNDETYI